MKFLGLWTIGILALSSLALMVGSLTVGFYAPDRYDGIPDMCLMPMDFGYCRAKVKRYYFDMRRMKCTMFYWGGCAGNINNFKSLDECNKLCLDSFESDHDIGAVTAVSPPVKDRQFNYNSRKVAVSNVNNNTSKLYNMTNKNGSKVYDSLSSHSHEENY